MSRSRLLVFYSTIALLSASPSAHAYLDPSTGSMIVSAIIGVFATLTLAIKTYWYKLKSFFTGKGGKAEVEDASRVQSEAGDPDVESS